MEGDQGIIEQLRREEKQGNLNHVKYPDSRPEDFSNCSKKPSEKKSEEHFAVQQKNDDHKEIIDSKDSFELIFQNTSNLVLFLDKTGKITKINKAGITFSGFTEDEILGNYFWKMPGVFSKKNVANYLKVFKNSLMGKKTEHFVATLNDKNGKTHTMDFSTYPILKHQHLNEILVIAKDITNLKESENRFRLIAENTSDLIALTTFSINPIYTYLSPSTKHIMGYNPEELIGSSCLELIHPADKKRILGIIGKYIKQKGKQIFTKDNTTISETFEYRIQDIQGNWHYLESTADLLDNQILIVSKDVTTKKKAEKKLTDSELQYRTIFNASNDVYLIFDLQGNIIDANNQAFETYGYPKEEFLHLSGADIVHPDYHHLFQRFITDVEEKGEFYAESVDVKKDGTIFPVEVKGTSFRLHGEKHLLATVRDITEKKKRKQQIKESEQKYQTYINNAPDAVFIANNTGAYIEVNEAAARITGYSKQELTSMHVGDFIPENDKDKAFHHFQQVLQQGHSSAEIGFIHKDGSLRYWNIDAVKIDENHLLGFCKDVTKERKLKQALIENQTFLDEILETTSDGILVLNEEFQYTYWNKAMETISQTPRKKILKRKQVAWELFPHLKENGVDQLMKQAMHGETVHQIGIPYQLKSGKTGYTAESFFPLYDSHEQIKGIVGVVRDITKEEQRKQELSFLADTANKFVTVKDENLFDLLGYSLKQIAPNSIIAVNLIHQNTLEIKKIIGIKDNTLRIVNRILGGNDLSTPFEGISNEAEQAFFSGKMRKIEGGLYQAFFEHVPRPICKTIEKLVGITSLYSIGLRQENKLYGSITFAVKKDEQLNPELIETVVNQASVALERQESFQQLQQMNKTLEDQVEKRTATIQQLLKQKDDFINQLGHDLKNPLGPVLHLIPLLEKHEQDEKYREMLQVMKRNAQYMKNLVTKTIQLAQLKSPGLTLHLEDIDLTEEIKEVLKTNSLLFEQNHIQINNHLTHEILIEADKLRIHEVFNNIINNAVKYSKKQGTITIESEKNDETIILSINDTGIGMTSDQINRIFDEFYKADGSRHDFDSSGLGMPICKRIIDLHHGKIWAESDGLNKGSTFYVQIPLHQPKS